MKIATWNVNSIRARQERLLAWLAKHQPDVLCLQELKVADDAYPVEALRVAGYHSVVFGQKAYNGVAILSRVAPANVVRGFDDGADEREARLVAATIGGVRVVSVYVPNGGVVGAEKWDHKLGWMRRLRRWLDRTCDPAALLAVCGDFNVAPDARDVASPAAWEGSVLFHPDVRAALEEVRRFGLVDVFRRHNEAAGLYSWWDYRMLAFPRNEGLRIDHVFATEPLARASISARIDRDARKGKQPSDHAPVVAEFQLD